MVQSSGANESKMEKHILWDFLLLLLFAGTNQVKNHMFGRSEEKLPAGRRKALSFLFDRVSSVTWEVKERKEAGGEKRETKTNREGKRERGRVGRRPLLGPSCSGSPSIFGCAHAPAAAGSKYGHWQGTSGSACEKHPHSRHRRAGRNAAERSGAEQSRAERNRMSSEQTRVSGSSTESHNSAVGPDWRCV